MQINFVEQFLLWQYSSQLCEAFFRSLRSISTTYSTIVNCSLLDALHRIKRIQLQGDISVMNFSEAKTFIFPRTKHMNSSFEVQDNEISASPLFELLLDKNFTNIEEIKKVLRKAKQDAFWMITNLGIEINIQTSEEIQTRFQKLHFEEDVFNELDSCNENHFSEENVVNTTCTEREIVEGYFNSELLQDLTILSNIIGHLELKNHSLNVLNESGPFTIVIDSRGNEFVVRKLSICWLLNKESSKLSDHFQRVRQSEYEKKEKLKNYSKNPHCNSIVVSKEINIDK